MVLRSSTSLSSSLLGCGTARAALAFSVVFLPEVVDAFDAVCAYGAATGSSVFPLPSAPRLRNERLQAEVKRIEQELSEHKAAAASYGLSIQTDGKDNNARRHLVNIITTTPLGPEFREVIDVSGQLRDATNTAQLLVDAVNRLPTVEQDQLVTIITDTPAVNRKVWELLEQKLPHVHCVPCAAHCLNLHFKHVFKQIEAFRTLVDNSKNIVARFSNTDFARQIRD